MHATLIIRIWTALAISFAAISSAPSGASAAEEPEKYVVLELFTSQGCSTCPPADRLLYILANAPPDSLEFLNESVTELIPLGLHVDYWDFLGWKDEMAQPGFSQRQRDYAASKNWPVIYTPQMVVQGTQPLVGSDWDTIKMVISSLDPSEDLAAGFAFSAGAGGHGLRIEPSVAETLEYFGSLDVLYVRYLQQPKSVAIGAGENRHRTIEYANVVTEMRKLGTWNPKEYFSLDLDGFAAGASKTERELILLQEVNFGRFVGVGILN